MSADGTRLFLNLLFKQALRPPVLDELRKQMILQHSPMFRWCGIAFTTFTILMVVFSLFAKVFFAAIGFLFFFGLSIYCLMEAFVVRVFVSETGLEQQSPWRTRRHIGWQEIEAVRFSKINKWFVVTGLKSKIRISFFLVGIRECAVLIFQKVPEARRIEAKEGLRELNLIKD